MSAFANVRERWEAYAAKASSTTTAPPPIPVHLLCVMVAVAVVNELKPVAGGGIRYPVSLPPTARLLTSLCKISFDRQPAVKITPVTVLVVILVNCPLKISKRDSRER